MKIEINLVWIFILLLILKLSGVIAWSWWVVTLPITVPLIIGVGVAVMSVLFIIKHR